MNTTPSNSFSKSSWGPGPWQDEPDREEWRDPQTGLPCLASRGPLGAWCGYVAVPPGHVLHGRDIWGIAEIEVHGGLTYSDKCQGKICHVPAPGEPDDVWWLGFDCGHGGDYMPQADQSMKAIGLEGVTIFEGGTYRDLAYVKAEITHLAAQLAERT